jgi:hypothetical protein
MVSHDTLLWSPKSAWIDEAKRRNVTSGHMIFPEKDTDGKFLPTMIPGNAVKDLFKMYGVLKLEDVQASNEWYRSYPSDPWYGDNMGLSYEYLKEHMATDLWTKVNEEYNRLPAATRGGPLLLYLMIKHLVAANEAAVKISSYKGEDVGAVVSHLRVLLSRLKSLRRCDAAGNEIDLVSLLLSHGSSTMSFRLVAGASRGPLDEEAPYTARSLSEKNIDCEGIPSTSQKDMVELPCDIKRHQIDLISGGITTAQGLQTG